MTRGAPKKLIGGHKVHLYLDEATIAAAKAMGGPKQIISAGIRAALKDVQALRLLPAPEADRAVSINAIHALLATLPPNALAQGPGGSSPGPAGAMGSAAADSEKGDC